MSFTVLLLSLLLTGIVNAQSTTESPTSTTIGDIVIEKQSVEKDGNKTNAQDDDDPLKAAESMDRFSFTEADARTTPQQILANDNDLGEDEDLAEVAEELTVLLDDDLKLFNDTPVNNTDTSVEDVDDVSDEDGENDEISLDSIKPAIVSQPEDIQIKRQGDLNPEFGQDADFNQPRRDDADQASDTPLYFSASDQSVNTDSVNDNSPLLQLTQGGYQRPYERGNRFNNPRQRMRPKVVSQSSETVENPTRAVDNDEQTRQPQITSQVTYTEPYQQQLGFASGLGFRNPFLAPDSFVNGNGMMPQAVQNSFFNIPPAGFTDFSGVNFQAPFSPSNDGRFQSIPRNPSSIPLFNAPPTHMLQQNPAYMLQNPQNQFLANDPLQPTRTLYQTGSFTNFQGPDNINDASGPDYSAFFRNPPPNNMQFQINSNPFVQRPAGSPLYNPLMNVQSNYPSFDDASPFSPRYPVTNGQIPVESTNQEEQKQQQGPETLATGDEAKDMVQINVSPNKEDPTAVPFGARIQKLNNPEDSDSFPAQKDVYLRYPLTEAGYAIEENLPDQNATDKTETANIAPPRPIFTFFQAPRQYRAYSGPDPYRSALNTIQRGLPIESNIRNDESSNGTRQNPPQQFVQSVPFPFNQRTPQPVFPGYSDRNQDASLLPIPTFYRTPDEDISGDPFERLTVFPDRNYQFPTNLPVRNPVQETNVVPACAQENNASMCFEDQEYPRREVLFALNSDSLLMDRLTLPDEQLDGISLVEQNVSESLESQDNYICKSDIKYGLPLRAKDIKGTWKVIINIEKAMGGGRFLQPVRLEVCKGAGEPCNFTQTKTACVQKYSLQRLLSWSPEKGVHNDVYKLPIACSCQLVDTQA
ncbi:neurotrophin 1 [Nephila pilipes]|uniref:Neurotrophin 1 n=1 Tax=Nephila pilipes TaxID=299642 RepID=A0A8X6U860_NEPPI|nr:neurotrophin 1 [Nephila pilipes]